MNGASYPSSCSSFLLLPLLLFLLLLCQGCSDATELLISATMFWFRGETLSHIFSCSRALIAPSGSITAGPDLMCYPPTWRHWRHPSSLWHHTADSNGIFNIQQCQGFLYNDVDVMVKGTGQ